MPFAEGNVGTSCANVTDFLLEGKNPHQVALQLLNTEYTYGDIATAANAVAHHCLALDLQKGDRVILVADNSFFWVAVYLGALRAGLVCVPLPPTVTGEELDCVIQTTKPRMLAIQCAGPLRHAVHVRGTHVLLDRPAQTLPGTLSQTALAGINTQGTQWQMPDVCPGDLAALMFTSGSTGQPRGVMVSHGNIMANTESIIQCLGVSPSDRVMTVLPFHYCFGTSLLHTHLKVGATLIIDSRFMYPELVLQRMIDTRCTAFAGVPSHFQILLRNSSLRKKRFPHLRYVQQAGGSLAPPFIRELREALPLAKIFTMYGQTEATARIACLPPEFLDTKCGSIGKGIPGVRVSVVNEAGVKIRPSEVGEIVVEGENVALGYWGDSLETAATFRGRKLHTGDLATVDDDGFIYIVDRAKDFLKCGGKRISCRQIENYLLECDGLIEAAVVAIPDEILGEAVRAFVVPRESSPDGIKEKLQQFCIARLPLQLQPREIVVVQSLPKNAAGKVLKRNLRAML